jgi:rhomboid protease GluP
VGYHAAIMDRPDEPHLSASPGLDAWSDHGDETGPAAARMPMDVFRVALFAQSPRAWATPLIVAANVVVFVLMVIDGVDPFWPNGPQQIEKLVEWGANFPPLTADGQWWRLGSAMFLHFGLLHIGMNMLALWNLGRLTERLCGSVGFLVLYAATGLIGSLGTVYYALFHAPAVSAGASGAIFGIAGVQLGYVFRQRRTLPPEFVAAIRRLGLNVVVFLVVFQFVPLVDNAAHIAGFIAGLVAGFAISQPVSPTARRGRWWRNLLALAGGAAVVAAGILCYPSDWSDYQTVLARLERLEQEANREIEIILAAHRKASIGDAQAAERLESEVLPIIDDMAERLEGVDRVAPEDKDELAENRSIIARWRADIIEKIAVLRRSAETQ